MWLIVKFYIVFKAFIASQQTDIHLKSADFSWLRYDDTVKFILDNCESKLWHDDVIAQVYACVTSWEVIAHLIKAVTHQNGLFQKGRIELFAAIPAIEFEVII